MGRSRFARSYWTGDPGGGGGGGGAPAGDPPKDPPADPPKDPLEGLTPEQKAEIQKRIGEAAGRARAEGKTTGKTEAETEATRKAQEAQGEFKALYETEKKRADDLAAKAGFADTIAPSVHSDITTEVSSWPEVIRKKDPGPTADLQTRLTWRNDNRELAAEFLKAQGKAPNTEAGGGGGAPPPKGGGGGGGKEGDEAKVAQNFMKGRYALPPGAKKD